MIQDDIIGLIIVPFGALIIYGILLDFSGWFCDMIIKGDVHGDRK